MRHGLTIPLHLGPFFCLPTHSHHQRQNCYHLTSFPHFSSALLSNSHCSLQSPPRVQEPPTPLPIPVVPSHVTDHPTSPLIISLVSLSIPVIPPRAMPYNQPQLTPIGRQIPSVYLPPPRVCTTPETNPIPNTHHMVPDLIKPDSDNPVHYRYQLRSR